MLEVTVVFGYSAFLEEPLGYNRCSQPDEIEPAKMVYRSLITIAQVVDLSNYFESSIQPQIYERAMIVYPDKIRLNNPTVEQFLLTTASIQ